MKRAILVFVILVIAALIGVSAYSRTRPLLAPQPQVGAGIYRLIGTIAEQDLSWSPDGRYLVGVTGYLPMPECWLCEKSYSEIILIDLQTMEKRTLLRNDGTPYIRSVSWFPDSTHVAYITDGNLLQDRFGASWSIGIDGQHEAAFMQFERQPIWSLDGSKLAAAGFAGQRGYRQWRPTIEVFDIQNNRLETVFQGSSGSGVSDPSWSPDGTKLAFSYGEIGS